MRIKNKKEWDFVIKETHEGDKNNRIKREILFIMECELSTPKPRMGFYKAMKEKYLSLEPEFCAEINKIIKEHESEIFETI